MSLNIELPKFNHPEVIAFYEHDLSIPKDKVAAILELPRATLVQDMETILKDSIERLHFFKDYPDENKWWELPKHAMFVLMELGAEEALPAVLEVLKQNDDYNWFWLSDFSTESFWEVIYHLGGNRLEELKPLVLTKGEWVNRIVPITAVTQIGLHQKERREEVLEWFRTICDAFLAMENEDPDLDEEVIASLIVDLINLRAVEFLPQIRLFSKRDLIFEGIAGDLASIEKDIQDPKYRRDRRKIQTSIYKRYEEMLSWYGYAMKYDEEYQRKEEAKWKQPAEFSSSYSPTAPNSSYSPSKVETVKREGKKVGRNDPCTCGSGKKYKKCCMRK
jgi:hypothetical protein